MGSFRIVKLQNPISLGLDLTANGAYDNGTAYSAGDSVSYNGSSYVAIQATTGNLPTDTTYWQLLASKGDTGANGDDGDAATITVGTVTTVEPTDPATVTNVGTTSAAVFDFDIPKGEDGADGADGVIQTVVAGTGISVDDTDPANPIVTNTQTSAEWGNITGDITDQTDLQTELGLKADDASVVHDTGAESIAGVKTFSDDPIVPAEAYGAGWDGSNEVPTKNDLYDKIETLGAGGQVLVTAVVAASGGDYTTLGAAIAAASNGWVIWVREGTYTESAISTSLTNLHIIGANPETTVLEFSTANCVFSGAGVKLQNLGFTQTTGNLTISGSDSEMAACRVLRSGNGLTSFSGAKQRVIGNSLIDNATTDHSSLSFSGTGKVVDCNYMELAPSNSSSLNIAATYSTFSGNNIKSLTTGGNQLLYISGNSLSISGNVITNNGASNGNMVRLEGASRVNFTGNTVIDGNQLISIQGSSSNNVISGNVFARTVTGSSASMFNIANNSPRNVISSNLLYEFNTTGAVLFNNAYIANVHLANTVIGNRFVRDATGSVGVVSHGTGTFSSNFCYTGGSVNTTITGTYANISGNTFHSGSGNELLLSANYATITNNQFTNYPTTGGINLNTRIGILATNNGLPDSLNRIVKRLKNTSGSTIDPGEIVTLKAVAAGNEVTTTTSASDNLVYGMAEESIANNATGFVLVEGQTTLLKVDGTTDIAIGDFITTFTTAGIGAKAAAGQLAIAIALEAYTGNDSNGVIDALIITPRRL